MTGFDTARYCRDGSGEPTDARLPLRTGTRLIFASSELQELAAALKRRCDREGQEWTVNHSRKRATEWATCLITPVATPPR